MEYDIGRHINFLEKEKTKLQADSSDIDAVALSVNAFIDRFYSKDSAYKGKIKTISSGVEMSKFGITLPGDDLPSLKTELEKLIDTIINEIKCLGFAKSKEVKIDKSVIVNTSVNQNQTVNLKIDFIIDVLKDELNDKQFKELQSIIEKEKDPKKAKLMVIEKIKEFGSNVASNILANILTNPVIWTWLFTYFEK